MGRKHILLDYSSQHSKRFDFDPKAFQFKIQDGKIPQNLEFDSLAKNYTLVVCGQGRNGELIRKSSTGKEEREFLDETLNTFFETHQGLKNNLGEVLRRVDHMLILVDQAGLKSSDWNLNSAMGSYVSSDGSLASRSIVAPVFECYRAGKLLFSSDFQTKEEARRYALYAEPEKLQLTIPTAELEKTLRKDSSWVFLRESPLDYSYDIIDEKFYVSIRKKVS